MGRALAATPVHGRAFINVIEVETVRQLIRRFNIPADSPTNDAWPWPIKIRAFGELLIQIDDESLVSKGKAQHKLLDLLRVIIALGAQAGFGRRSL